MNNADEQPDPAELDRMDFLTQQLVRETGMFCDGPLLGIMHRVDGERVVFEISSYARAAQLLNETPTQVKFRASPPIHIDENQGILCNVSNVSNAVRTVRVDLILPSGQPRNNTDFFTITLDPGASASGSVSLVSNTYYCKFTVVGEGTRADIRGSTEQLTTPQPGTGSRIGAVIPAE